MSVQSPDNPGEPNVVVEPPDVPEENQDDDEEPDAEEPAENDLTEIARAVGRGEWGVGQERRQRLTEAGYNPKEVQDELVRLSNH